MSEEKKQKLKEYQKQRYREAKESRNNTLLRIFNTLLRFYLRQFV